MGKIIASVIAGLCLGGLAAPSPAEADPDGQVVVLLLDISLSMGADDIAPDRVTALREETEAFALGLDPAARLGLVVFAGNAYPLVLPTVDHESVARAIKEAITHGGLKARTATGEGIYTALTQTEAVGGATPRIILVSDGKETVPDDLDDPRGAFTAAREARNQRIRIDVISLGTSVPIPYLDIQGSKVPVNTDEPSLRKIADLADGTFAAAASHERLRAALGALADEIR